MMCHNRCMKVERRIGKCIDISFEGKGVFKDKDGIVFVDGLFIGEEAEIDVLYRRNGQYYGKVRRLIRKSPSRIQPLCGVCTACGGCQFQQLDYPAQLEYKTNKVRSALKRHLNKDIEVNPCIGMDYPYEYRNKIQVPLGRDTHGKLVSGFYRANTHEIIPIDKCYIENPGASEIIKTIKVLMKEFKLEPYDEDTGYGLIRHVLIRTSYHYKEIMVTVVTTRDEFKGKNNFVRALVKKHPLIKSVVQNINSRHTNVILGEKSRVLYGTSFIKDSILGVVFHISSKSFYQVNPIQVEILYDIAIKNAKLNVHESLLDAYCGIGTIGLIASKHAESVVGVEIVPDAIKNAKDNARINNITNAKFYCDDASKFMLSSKIEGNKFDVVFVDPPRKGLDDSFIESLLELSPRRIVYISCEPETLAENLVKITTKYKIESVQPVDLFPMTYHVETVVILTRL